MIKFYDRAEAGWKLGQELLKYKADKPLILALPRGGVPIGIEIAKTLNAPLNVIVVRKLGAPGQNELGIGAIAEGGVKILDNKTIALLNISKDKLQEIINQENEELIRRVKVYRKGKKLTGLKNKTVIIVDDGLATGLTAKAAIAFVKKQKPKKIIFAAPICAIDSAANLRKDVDELICSSMPSEFRSVGSFYENFPQLFDQQVIEILNKANLN